jgi:hypothetical protein
MSKTSFLIVLPQIAVRLDGFDTIIAHFSAFWNSFLKFFLDFQILFYGVGQKLLCKWRFLPALVPEIRFQFHFRVNINGTNVIAVINPNHFSVQPIPLHQRTVYIFQQFVLDQMREIRFQCPALFLKNHFVCNRADTVMVHCI